jgi:hypothetical protein
MSVSGKKKIPKIRELRLDREFFGVGELFYLNTPTGERKLLTVMSGVGSQWCRSDCSIYQLCHDRIRMEIDPSNISEKPIYPLPMCNSFLREDGKSVYFKEI